MNNLIKSFAVAAAMLMTIPASADDASYLYWMTEGSQYWLHEGWTSAKVLCYKEGQEGEPMEIGINGEGSAGYSKNLQNPYGEFSTMLAIVPIGSTVLGNSYKFALELLNDQGKVVRISDWVAYDASYFGSQSLPSSSQMLFKGFQVPEPTGGLLVMMGFGLLALRRKQKKA